MEKELEQFKTIDEIALELRISSGTVRNMIKAGQLPATKIGHQYRIKESDFEFMVEQGSTTSSKRA